MYEGSGTVEGLGTRMGTGMLQRGLGLQSLRALRLSSPLLLMLALLLSVAGCAAKGTSEDAKAKVFPWKTGDVIKAEYVDYAFAQGFSQYTLITPEGFLVEFCINEVLSCEDETESDGKLGTGSVCTHRDDREGSVGEVMDFKNFGLQILITFKEGIYNRTLADGTINYYIDISKIQLDTDPNAPRNTLVLGNQEITGEILCPNYYDDLAGDAVYLVTKKRVRHELVSGNPRQDIRDWCDVEETVTLHGDILLWTEQRYFRTRDAPPSPEDTSD